MSDSRAENINITRLRKKEENMSFSLPTNFTPLAPAEDPAPLQPITFLPGTPDESAPKDNNSPIGNRPRLSQILVEREKRKFAALALAQEKGRSTAKQEGKKQTYPSTPPPSPRAEEPVEQKIIAQPTPVLAPSPLLESKPAETLSSPPLTIDLEENRKVEAVESGIMSSPTILSSPSASNPSQAGFFTSENKSINKTPTVPPKKSGCCCVIA